MFTGMSAFPLTPLNESKIDEHAYLKIITRLVDAKVDSICVQGSTGSYAYLTLKERAHLLRLAVEKANGIPVMTSIGALRTRDVLIAAENAQKIGASALLLAPVSYQKLTEDEVFSLYETVAGEISVPLCIYESPGTTHFDFSPSLLLKLARLPNVASIKLLGGYPESENYLNRITNLKSALPAHVSLGISGDVFAASSLSAGCRIWYSVIGGLFPRVAMKIAHLAISGKCDEAAQQSAKLAPLWALFRQYGSLRVVASAAAMLGLAENGCLPLPLKTLHGDARKEISDVIESVQLS